MHITFRSVGRKEWGEERGDGIDDQESKARIRLLLVRHFVNVIATRVSQITLTGLSKLPLIPARISKADSAVKANETFKRLSAFWVPGWGYLTSSFLLAEVKRRHRDRPWMKEHRCQVSLGLEAQKSLLGCRSNAHYCSDRWQAKPTRCSLRASDKIPSQSKFAEL